MTYEEMKNNEEVNALLEKGNRNLGVLGFTDHSMAHCALVAERAAYILKKLDYLGFLVQVMDLDYPDCWDHLMV